MLDANKVSDIKEISKYGKARGFLVAKRYKLPTYSNFYIIENEEEAKLLLEQHKEQEKFCMRADTTMGNVPLGIDGKNGNRETIFEYLKEIKEKSKELGINGAAIIYWNKGKFCPTYDTDGCFYLDYCKNRNALIIDYVGKGWDGSFLSHGTACHETYEIPWKDILFFDENNKNRYRKQIISEQSYSKLREDRIKDLIKDFGLSLEECNQVIPNEYKGIKSEHLRQTFNQVILPMYDRKDLQRYYQEYIAIAQIENDKVLVPEIILPERLRQKAKSTSEEER
jgi:hypothetical protein